MTSSIGCYSLRNCIHIVQYPRINSTKSLLLLSTRNGSKITRTILDIELDINLATKVSLAAIQCPGLDTGHLGHDLDFGIEAGAAGGAEEVLVNFAACADGVVGAGGSYINK